MVINKSAFTLIEMIIVVILVAILAVIAIIKYNAKAEKARSAVAYAVLSDIAATENSYYAEYNIYTSTWSALDRYDAAPASDYFDFEISSTDASAGYASAKGKGVAQNSYGMCLKSGKKNSSACAVGSACNPGCP